MEALALIRFDSFVGPVVHFLVADGMVGEEKKEELSNMLNLNISKDYFIFRFENTTTYNMQFYINSMFARGHKELLMVTMTTEKFPLKKIERFFLSEIKDLVKYLKSQSCLDYIFHLDREFTDDEMKIIEDLYETVLAKMKELHQKIMEL
ncbi:MAG: hypothetical protein ACFFCS_06670 [Candidatus Hodarchaeota archaeon]